MKGEASLRAAPPHSETPSIVLQLLLLLLLKVSATNPHRLSPPPPRQTVEKGLKLRLPLVRSTHIIRRNHSKEVLCGDSKLTKPNKPVVVRVLRSEGPWACPNEPQTINTTPFSCILQCTNDLELREITRQI